MATRLLAVIGFSLVALGTAAGSAQAAAVTYPGAAPCDTTLQACITGVADGTIIRIATDGPIDESLTISKSLTLEAAAGFAPMIGGGATMRSVGVSAKPSGDPTTVEIAGLTLEAATIVQNFQNGSGHRFVLRDSTVRSNVASNGGLAVQLASSVPAELVAVRNHVSSQGTALEVFATPGAGTVVATVAANELTSPRPQFSEAGLIVVFGGDGVARVDVHDNVVHHVAGCFCGVAAALTVVSSGSVRGTANVVHNTIHRTTNKGGGVTLGGPQGTSRLRANLFDNVVAGISGRALIIDAPPSDSRLSLSDGYNDVVRGGEPHILSGHELGPGTRHVGPRFVDPASRDYRLGATSPLIDAGLTCQPGEVRRTDASGRFRVTGPETDVGAYEFGARRAGRGVVLFGGPGSDDLVGTRGRDVLCGMGGNDRLRGKAGSDFLGSGSGRDRLVAGAGGDVARGGPGGDRILGGPGGDRLYGEAGADPCLDTRDGVRSNDSLHGGRGLDGFRADRGDRVRSAERAC